MDRRNFVKRSVIGGVALATVNSVREESELSRGVTESGPSVPAFELDEITINDLQSAMASGKYTAQSLTGKYLSRIDDLDKHGPAINSVIEVNPDAPAIAGDLDKERKAGHVRGPLHGIPVLIKDNI